MIKCFRDDKGWRRADVGSLPKIIESFLEQDIQNSVSSCDEYLAIGRDVTSGKQKNWSGTGNAHLVVIDPEKILIENIWDENVSKATLTHSEFCECLTAWKDFLERDGEKRVP